MKKRVRDRHNRAALVAAFLLVVLTAACFVGCAVTPPQTVKSTAEWKAFRVECETRNTAFYIENKDGLAKENYVAFFTCPGDKRFRVVVTYEFFDAVERGSCVEFSGEVKDKELRNPTWNFPCASQRPQPRWKGETA